MGINVVFDVDWNVVFLILGFIFLIFVKFVFGKNWLYFFIFKMNNVMGYGFCIIYVFWDVFFIEFDLIVIIELLCRVFIEVIINYILCIRLWFMCGYD